MFDLKKHSAIRWQDVGYKCSTLFSAREIASVSKEAFDRIEEQKIESAKKQIAMIINYKAKCGLYSVDIPVYKLNASPIQDESINEVCKALILNGYKVKQYPHPDPRRAFIKYIYIDWSENCAGGDK